MEGISQSHHFRVGPVSSQCILSQIIGANAEEVHQFNECVSHQSSGRQLDHNPNLNMLCVAHILLCQRCCRSLQVLSNCPYLFAGSNHWEHKLEGMSDAGAQEGA